MTSLKSVISKQIKHKKNRDKLLGFTLIELLVGMILSALVITPLLGLMINIMQTERREQAKTTTEQELKAAIDFITRDLEQAVYIYDADGIAAIKSQLPQSNNSSTHFPVLVFWKRQHINKGILITGNNCNNPDNCDDTFVYSLVAYYLIKDNNANWSNTARIGRFQISDGYGNDTQKAETKDAGFKLFDLQGRGDLKTKMNNWQKDGTYQQQILPLVDYIDQTTGVTPSACPSGMQQIPDFSGTINGATASGAVKTGSFYSCVDSLNTVAEVYLRGNSLARIQATPPTYNQQKKIFFPEVNVKVKGRGFIFTK